jgi:hypothetical protein
MAYYIKKDWSLSTEPPGVKIPTAAAFLFVPVIGLAFLMFLPAAGFYLVGKGLVELVSVTWSGMRGSNPRSQVGNLKSFH